MNLRTDIPNLKKMFKEARSNFGLFTQFFTVSSLKE